MFGSLACIEDAEEDTEERPNKHVPFEVVAPYEPTGDQPQAIRQLIQQLQGGDKFSVLKGITGTGKTYVMSHVIAKWRRPTLVLCHNKTLAAQLARELRSFLPKNSVELFVSYYNHYLPERSVNSVCIFSWALFIYAPVFLTDDYVLY